MCGGGTKLGGGGTYLGGGGLVEAKGVGDWGFGDESGTVDWVVRGCYWRWWPFQNKACDSGTWRGDDLGMWVGLQVWQKL